MVNMSLFGEIFLAAIFLLCSFTTIFALLASRLELTTAERLLFWARRALVIAIELSAGVLIFLVVAFLTNDFSIAVVAQHSSTNLPLFYKLTAVWASSPGSLLVWFTFQFILFGVWVITCRVKGLRFEAAALVIGTGVCLAFSALLLFIARPFAHSTITVNEGAGLNPLLQNFWMVIHPPLLFIGYSAFLIPFVIVFASAFSGRLKQPQLYQQTRRWLLLGICFLGLGIATGARWAYLELGWAGYWAWDPVESASLLPWLAAVAALHSIMGIRLSEKFRFWAVALSPVPFILCLLATFITRSGILKSVHAFDYNAMSAALLLLIACCVALWLICIIRAATVSTVTASHVAGFYSATGQLLFWANIILILTAAIIGVAIFWPVISRTFTASHTGSLLPRLFYDRVIAASGIILALLLGLAQLSTLQLRRGFIPQVLTCCMVGLFSFALMRRFAHLTFLMSLACGICAFSFVATFMNILSNLKATYKIPGQIAHLGLLALVVAAGLSSSEQAIETTLTKGEKIIIAGYEIAYDSFQQKSAGGITRAGPQFILTKKGRQVKLWPHNSLYPDGRSTAEVAVHTTLFKDIYLVFGGLTQDGQVKVAAKAKPLMLWVWLAVLLILIGPAAAALRGRGQRRAASGQNRNAELRTL